MKQLSVYDLKLIQCKLLTYSPCIVLLLQIAIQNYSSGTVTEKFGTMPSQNNISMHMFVQYYIYDFLLLLFVCLLRILASEASFKLNVAQLHIRI